MSLYRLSNHTSLLRKFPSVHPQQSFAKAHHLTNSKVIVQNQAITNIFKNKNNQLIISKRELSFLSKIWNGEEFSFKSAPPVKSIQGKISY